MKTNHIPIFYENKIIKKTYGYTYTMYGVQMLLIQLQLSSLICILQIGKALYAFPKL